MSLTILQKPPVLLLTGAPVVFKIQSNSTSQPLRLLGGVTTLASDSVPADANKQARFELSDYLDGLVTSRYKLLNSPSIYSNNPFPVSFRFHEFYGTPPSQQNTLGTGLFYVLDGKIPASLRKKFYVANPSLLDYLVLTKSCLTWWPWDEYKKVGTDQMEFLNYLQLQSTEPVTLMVRVSIFYTDWSYDVLSLPYAQINNVGYMNTVYFPVGYNQLGIQSWVEDFGAGRTVQYYYVTIHCDALNYSRVYKFEVDHSYVENPRYLWIRNAFGFLEVLRTTGKSEQINEFKPDIAQTDGITLADKIAWNIAKTDNVKVNSGWLTPLQVQWLSDLLESTEAYELIGTTLHPIVFKDLKVPVVHDGEYQYNVDIEYEYAFNLPIETAP